MIYESNNILITHSIEFKLNYKNISSPHLPSSLMITLTNHINP